jgi:hypothetical protein
MKKGLGMAALLAAALSWQAPALAHGGSEHLMGTVKAVDDQSLTVKTKSKEVKVKLDLDTKFEKSGAAATAKDLSIGERGVVHTREAKDGQTAALVKFGATKTAEAPAQGHNH